MKTLSKKLVIRWGKHNLVESAILYIYSGVVQHIEVCVCVWLRAGGWGKLIWYIKPLHPNISIYILHTDLCMSPKVLTRRVWLAM